MVKRVRFLRYMDSYRLVYRFEWDMIAVTVSSLIIIFASATILQAPLWLSPFFAAVGSWKTLKLYKSLIKEAAPGYLYHFFYSIGIINPVSREKRNGKIIRTNPDNIPFGFENDFRD